MAAPYCLVAGRCVRHCELAASLLVAELTASPGVPARFWRGLAVRRAIHGWLAVETRVNYRHRHKKALRAPPVATYPAPVGPSIPLLERKGGRESRKRSGNPTNAVQENGTSGGRRQSRWLFTWPAALLCLEYVVREYVAYRTVPRRWWAKSRGAGDYCETPL